MRLLQELSVNITSEMGINYFGYHISAALSAARKLPSGINVHDG
jgi:hypothetical protein